MHYLVPPNQPRFANVVGFQQYLTNSDDLSHADWTKTNCTVEQDGTKDPFGNDAWKITDDGTAGLHGVWQEDYQPYSSPLKWESDIGCLVKAGTQRYLTLDWNITATGATSVTYDLETGQIIDGAMYYVQGAGSATDQEWVRRIDDEWVWVAASIQTSANGGSAADCLFLLNDDGVSANNSYTGTGKYLYISKPYCVPRAYWNMYNEPFPFELRGSSGDNPGVTGWVNRLERVNLCCNSELHGYAGKGTLPFRQGYYHTHEWYDTGAQTANADAVIISHEDLENLIGKGNVSTRLQTYPTTYDGHAWATTRQADQQKKGVRVYGTNQQYAIKSSSYYTGYYVQGKTHTFSIVLHDITERPTGPVLAADAAWGGATATIPENAGPGTRISIPVTIPGTWQGYLGVNIGLGADGNNDTGDFTWSSPQFETGSKVTPYIANDATGWFDNYGFLDEWSEEASSEAGLLVAPSLTDEVNATVASRNFTDASWIKTNMGGSNQSRSRPGLVINQHRMQATTTGGPGTVSIEKNFTTTASTQYTTVNHVAFSRPGYAKMEIANMGALNPYVNLIWDGGANIDWSSSGLGTVSGDVDSSAALAPDGYGGFQTCWWTWTSDAVDTAVTYRQYIGTADNVTNVTPFANTSVCYNDPVIYKGPYRPWEHLDHDFLVVNADVIRTTDMSWYNEAGGTIFMDFTTGYDLASKTLLTLSDGTANNRIVLETTAGGAGQLRVIDGGTPGATISLGALAVKTRYKFAVSFQDNNVMVSLDGSTGGTADTSVTLPTSLTQLDVGHDQAGANQFGGLVHGLVYDDAALSQTDINTITSADGLAQDGTDALFNEKKHAWVCARNGEEISVDGYNKAMRKLAGIAPRDANDYANQDLHDRAF